MMISKEFAKKFEKVLVKADKSRKIYQWENITKASTKNKQKRLNAVNKQANKIAEKLST